MSIRDHTHLTRRERQIVDVLYELGWASAADIQEKLPDPPSYSAVRAMLAKLERKGHIRHKAEGPRYLYRAVLPQSQARLNAMSRLVRTFFDGSVRQAINGLMGLAGEEMTDEEWAELVSRLENERKRGLRDE